MPSALNPSLAERYRTEVLPRLRPEALFSAVRSWGAKGRAEWRGACPLHGGNNRQALSVEPRPPYRWHCMSGCGGGDALTWIALREFGEPPNGEHFAASVAIAAQMAGVHLDVDGGPPTARRWSPPAAVTSLEAHSAPAPTADDARKVALVRTLWAAGDDSDESLAIAYLRRRLAWPPAAVARHYGLPRPPAVRWMPRELLERSGRLGALPDGSAGAIAYGYTAPVGGDVLALQFDALSAAGERSEPRWRRGMGSRAGLVFRVLGRAAALPRYDDAGVCSGGALAIAEGEATALALALRPDVAEARAAGGTAGMRAAAIAEPPGDYDAPVLLAPDADPAGAAAALRLWAELKAAGRNVRLLLPDRQGGGRDGADRLADRVCALAAVSGQHEAWLSVLADEDGAAW